MIYFVEKNGRYTKDFTYIFGEQIKIEGYVSLIREDKDNDILSLDKVKERIISSEEIKLIICRSPENSSRKDIESYGILYNQDWIYAEDLFSLLDKKHLESYIVSKKVICWGAGNIAKEFLNRFPFLEVSYFVDMDREKVGKQLHEKPIYNIEKLYEENPEECFVFIAAPYLEVKTELEVRGWKEGKQFIDVRAFPICPSSLMKNILEAPTILQWQCHYPFEHIRITQGGQYSYCSFAEAEKIGLGNIYYQDYWLYEQSIILKLVRLSALNGTYIFCNPTKCAKVRQANILNKEEKKNEEYPFLSNDCFKVASVDIDDSCNLYCSSCRKQIINYKTAEKQLVTERVMEQLLPNIDILFIAGMGELFLSPYYKQILHSNNYRKLKGIMTLSNGNICNKEEWDYIIKLVNGNVVASFSIDAATEETYKKVRRGGNYKKMEEHIRYVCSLRKKGYIRRVFLNFVIQRENYKELEQFVLWGKEMGVDYFNITYLDNWGTWTEEEFRKICMYETKENLSLELQKELKKLDKYGDCILLDSATRYREMNYNLLLNSHFE